MKISVACAVLFLPFVVFFQGQCLGACQVETFVSARNSPEQVYYAETWMTPESVAKRNQHNSLLAEYSAIRDQFPDSFEGQTELARWCNSRNLDAQCDAHLKRALVHNPESAEVRNRLGHVNVNGTWQTGEVLAEQNELALAAKRRFDDWQQPVEQIARLVNSRKKKQNDAGWQQLREINDPRSITALEVILAPVSETASLETLETINRFPEREATESLMRIAMTSRWPTVREQGLALLSGRNHYDFVPTMLKALVSPVSTRYIIAPSGNGNVLYQYVLFQKNMETDVVRQFDLLLRQNPAFFSPTVQQRLALDANSRAMMAEVSIRQLNASIESVNREIQHALKTTTGADPGDSPEAWWDWWYLANEIYTSVRPVSYTRVQETQTTASPTIGTQGECLVAGTPIWTDRGPLPVESLKIGDRVLCQDINLQKLEYQIVLLPTVRPPTPTFRIQLDGELITASGGHLFWVTGLGWTKVRDLTTEMTLSTAGGNAARIQRIESGETVPLFNLIVDQQANYFVGANKVLSHDSTIQERGAKSVEPVTAR